MSSITLSASFLSWVSIHSFVQLSSVHYSANLCNLDFMCMVDYIWIILQHCTHVVYVLGLIQSMGIAGRPSILYH